MDFLFRSQDDDVLDLEVAAEATEVGAAWQFNPDESEAYVTV